MNRIFWYIFILILVLIVVVYYRGTSSVVSTGGTALSNIIRTLQGRNQQGQFANYPGGA